ncbi:MAG: malonyl-ACP O-methyltransferase BioC [Gammaproteobacteria bacterium]|nr:malonyl-ACP O-methyltransferase BioC [Gammaproteobacteria bacterium]
MPSIRDAFNNAAVNYNKHALIQKEVAFRTDQKFDLIRPNNQTILDLGSGTGLLTDRILSRFPKSQIIIIDFAYNALLKNKAKTKICADTNKLPIKDNSVDIIVSSLMMQWCTDLNKFFVECFRVLKSDGLILFSTFGPDTLKELKKSWSVVDNKDHVNKFIDMHDIGDQLLNNGFQDPVMEMEKLVVNYETVVELLRDIKGIGAQTVIHRSKSLTGKSMFNGMVEMYESYRKDGKIPATYEVVYGHAWKKTDSLEKISINYEDL